MIDRFTSDKQYQRQIKCPGGKRRTWAVVIDGVTLSALYSAPGELIALPASTRSVTVLSALLAMLEFSLPGPWERERCDSVSRVGGDGAPESGELG